MDNREKFLKRFIETFYEKSRKRKTPRNIAPKVADTINKAFKNHFDRKLQFEENEIIEMFKECGYTVTVVKEEERTRERFHNHHFLIYNDEFLNIRTRINDDILLSWKEYKPNFKQETIDRVEELKGRIKAFWEENKELVSN